MDKLNIKCKQLNISQNDIENWKNQRGWVGGSDASVACGENGYKSLVSLVQMIYDKENGKWVNDPEPTKEEKESFEKTFPPMLSKDYFFWLGHKREEVGRELYSSITGNSVEEGFIWVPEDLKWKGYVHVSPDGIVKDSKGPQKQLSILEIKSHYLKLPPETVPIEYILQIYHTFLLLNPDHIDYFAVAYDCSTQKNFEDCVINDIKYIRFYRSELMIKWYYSVISAFIEHVKKGFSFDSNEKWKIYVNKTFGNIPLGSVWHYTKKHDRDYFISPKVESIRGKTLEQAREILSIANMSKSDLFE